MASSPDAGPRHVGRVTDPLVREDGELEPELELGADSSGSADAHSTSGEHSLAGADSETSSVGGPDQSAGENSQPDESSAAASETSQSEPSSAATPETDLTISEHAPEPATADETSDEDARSSEPAPGLVEGSLPRGAALRERLLARAAARPMGALRADSPTPDEPDAGSSASELDQVGREPKKAGDRESEPAPVPIHRPPSAPRSFRDPRRLSPSLLAVFGTLLGLATVASIVALVLALDARQHPELGAASSSTPVSSAPALEAPAAPAAPHVQKRVRQKVPGPWRIADAKNQPELRLIEGKIGLSPFLRAVEESGVKSGEAYRVLRALGGLTNLDKCEKSDRFLALVERSSGRLKAFEYVASEEKVYQAREAADGALVGSQLDLKITRNQVEGAIVYEGGEFEKSADRWGFDPGLGRVLGRALDGQLGLDELERGDRIRVLVQELTVLGEFARYAGVEAVEIVFADSQKKPFRLYYFQGPQSRGYFDAVGRQPFEGGWRKPIKDAQISSRFNPKRLHPILKKVMPHNGIDFGAPAGAPVGASSFGTVSFIGYAGASGNLVKVDHPGGITTGYAHLSRFAEGLKLGDHVKRLQLIGYVGSTGRSTGPHLHFSAEKDDKFFDPETLNLDGLRTLPRDERELFGQVKQKYDRLIDAIRMPDALPPEPQKTVAAAPGALEPELEDDSEASQAAAKLPSSKPQPPSGTSPAAATAGGSSASAVYLTDKELLKMQPASDEGEVSE